MNDGSHGGVVRPEIALPRRGPAGVSEAVRLVADGPRVIQSRPAAVVAGVAGRLRGRVHVAWPDLSAPSMLVPVATTGPARWLRKTFQPNARLPPGLSAATWIALRGHGALIGGRPGLAVGVAEHVLGRALDEPQAVVWSASADGGAKSNAFVFERGGEDPLLMVRMLPDRRRSHRLVREAEMITAVRRLLSGAPDVLAALPQAVLYAGVTGGVQLTAEAIDPLGGVSADDPRARAFGWLAALQRATATTAPWGPRDTEAAREMVSRAWALLRPATAEAMATRTAELLEPLEGAAVFRCVQHGDLWRGNVAIRGEQMRIYDWEWARLEAPPFLDLWTYDLAEHRSQALHGRGRLRPLPEAVADVEAALRALGMAEGFALASLPVSAAELTCRSRWQDEISSGSEEGSLPLMEAIESLVLAARPVG